MKKVLVVILTIFSFFALSVSVVKADSANIITNGDFEGMLNNGADYVLGEGDNMKNGYGSGAWDSPATVTKDPLNAENTVLKFSHNHATSAFASIFKFCTVESGVTYTVSLKYLVEGSTLNFGMRFAPVSNPDIAHTFYAGGATDGWQTATFELTTLEGATYNSIGLWFDTAKSDSNVGYVDDIVITKKVEGGETPEVTPIVSGGDFEGFLEQGDGEELVFGDPAFGSGVAKGWGSINGESPVKAVKDPVDADNTVIKFSYTEGKSQWSSFFKFCGLEANVKYQIDLDYYVEGTTDNFGMRFAGAPALEKTFYAGGSTDVWQHASWEWTTEDGAKYDSIAIWFNTKGSAVGYVDNIVVTELERITPEPKPTVTNPFDPEKTYYQSKSMTVNGDFEAFEVGTVLSREQLEGAWGSLENYDNPAVIAEDNGSKVLKLGYGEKAFSSAFLMLPTELEQDDLVRLSYDIKLNLTADSYVTINSSFTGVANEEYFEIEFTSFELAEGTVAYTSGPEDLHFPIKITAKENGWYNVTIDFQLFRSAKIQCDSLRWLFSKAQEGDYMMIDNVNLYMLSETPFAEDVKVSKVEFKDGDSVSLKVGEEKVLEYTINPTDATDKTVTFKSSNANVATVDANGKVVAVGKGACTITVTAANGVKDEIAVLVTEVSSGNSGSTAAPSNGCGGSVVASIFGLVALAGAAVVVRKRREQ